MGVALAVAVLAAVGAVAAVAGPGRAPAAPAAHSVPAPPPAPGTDNAVTGWMQQREPLQIELNNALQQFAALPAATDRRSAARVCTRLAAADAALEHLGRVPAAELDAALRAGLASFRQGAAACLHGDLAGARALVATGLAERTAAADQIDDMLDGD
jgi:hypothetical protein